jgi:hypothetical protein
LVALPAVLDERRLREIHAGRRGPVRLTPITYFQAIILSQHLAFQHVALGLLMLDLEFKRATRKIRTLRLALALGLLTVITAASVFAYSMADELMAMME